MRVALEAASAMSTARSGAGAPARKAAYSAGDAGRSMSVIASNGVTASYASAAAAAGAAPAGHHGASPQCVGGSYATSALYWQPPPANSHVENGR